MRLNFFWIVFLVCISAIGQRNNFPDVLNLQNKITTDTNIVDHNVFADLGAWHAYALPKKKEDYGSFIGPMTMDKTCKWLGNNFTQLEIKTDGKMVDLANASSSIHYYPGLLQQDLVVPDLKITMKLIFVSSRAAMLQTSILNTGNKNQQLAISWHGKSLLGSSEISSAENSLAVRFTDNNHLFFISYSNEMPVAIDVQGQSYTAMLSPLVLKGGALFQTDQTQSYYLDKGELTANTQLLGFEKELQKNKKRWDGYLSAYFSKSKIKDDTVKRLAVKCIVTLTTNWRSSGKALFHDGVFPSMYYHGFWSWDNWKHAAAIALFDPELAKNCVFSLFDYQDEYGMIPDCIFTDTSKNNVRDTKPPLAAWAVWRTFENGKDTAFIKNIYPKLLLYHQWWYANRDHNKNGLCEYGSTDGTLEAAGWESGMDNAVRFDSCRMLKNNEHAWSLNQESVDLNAYLYVEKIYLIKLAAIAGHKNDIVQMAKEAASLKASISNFFYSNTKGFYFDRVLETGKLQEVEAYEGWLPLWAKTANAKQAKHISAIMGQPNKFNTNVPMPSLAADDPKFNPQKGYWRGPVWLDQFYFGMVGLKNYGFAKQSKIFCQKLLANTQGMRDDNPFQENYNPVTGAGIGTANFSWSAAHVLMLAQEGFFNKK